MHDTLANKTALVCVCNVTLACVLLHSLGSAESWKIQALPQVIWFFPEAHEFSQPISAKSASDSQLFHGTIRLACAITALSGRGCGCDCHNANISLFAPLNLL